MRVLVLGPEDTGTKYVVGALRQAGAEADHWSVPAGGDWKRPKALFAAADAVVVTMRHGPVAARAQVAHHVPEHVGGARDRIFFAYAKIFRWLFRSTSLPVYLCSLDELQRCAAPCGNCAGVPQIFATACDYCQGTRQEPNRALALLLEDLGIGAERARGCDAVVLSNEKWYGGPAYSDHRPESERGVATWSPQDGAA